MSAVTPVLRHEALLYAGMDEFLAGTLPFIQDAVAAGEPILVALAPAKITLLREALGDDADRVQFADMTALGGNPARILPVWRDFVDAHAGRGKRVRGIGEPVWPGRSAAEVEECVCHESLLNVAFAECEDFWLVCPYDVTALDPAAVATARVTHPLVIEDGAVSPSPHYSVERHLLSPPLAEPDVDASMLDFDGDRLAQVRALVAQHAEWAGLGAERIKDLLVAANEVATNSIRHGGGSGTVRVWRDDGALVCEIRDRGYMTDPLIGRRRPANLQGGGYGVWIVNQLCDLVQIRSSADGSVVRMTARR